MCKLQATMWRRSSKKCSHTPILYVALAFLLTLFSQNMGFSQELLAVSVSGRGFLIHGDNIAEIPHMPLLDGGETLSEWVHLADSSDTNLTRLYLTTERGGMYSATLEERAWDVMAVKKDGYLVQPWYSLRRSWPAWLMMDDEGGKYRPRVESVDPSNAQAGHTVIDNDDVGFRRGSIFANHFQAGGVDFSVATNGFAGPSLEKWTEDKWSISGRSQRYVIYSNVIVDRKVRGKKNPTESIVLDRKNSEFIVLSFDDFFECEGVSESNIIFRGYTIPRGGGHSPNGFWHYCFEINGQLRQIKIKDDQGMNFVGAHERNIYFYQNGVLFVVDATASAPWSEKRQIDLPSWKGEELLLVVPLMGASD